jgi:putative DNA primase/helicase
MDRSRTTPAAGRGSKTNDIQHNNFTHGDAIYQFKNAMLDALGCFPENIIGNGSLHRFKIDGKLNGWYVLHLDGRAAGCFGDWKQGIKCKWKMSGKFMPLSEYQHQTFKAQCQREEAKRKAEEASKRREAAKKAAYIWNKATHALANHPYLTIKRIKPHGARIVKNNTLVIPLFNANKELVNLQFISENGTKRFLSGGQKKGCFYPIGELKSADIISICEGFATGASLYEHEGKSVVIAFDAGNLKAVAIEIRSLFPKAEIFIAADNDESGVGEDKAREAARAIGCKYLMPNILGDFNDYFAGSL